PLVLLRHGSAGPHAASMSLGRRLVVVTSSAALLALPWPAASAVTLNTGPVGGYVARVAVDPVDPGIALITTFAGIERTTDAGASWNTVSTDDDPFGACGAITFAPS